MDWITLSLLASMALLALTLMACLHVLRDLRAAQGAKAPQPQRFVVLVPGSAPQGPIDRSTLRAMLIDGRLDPLALAAAVEGGHWRPVAELALAEDGPALPQGAPSATHNPWRS